MSSFFTIAHQFPNLRKSVFAAFSRIVNSLLDPWFYTAFCGCHIRTFINIRKAHSRGGICFQIVFTSQTKYDKFRSKYINMLHEAQSELLMLGREGRGRPVICCVFLPYVDSWQSQCSWRACLMLEYTWLMVFSPFVAHLTCWYSIAEQVKLIVIIAS